MRLEFEGTIFSWRGPAPFLFVAIPEAMSQDIRAIATTITYGWGVIPVQVQVGATVWTTSLFPKDGRYLVPIKALVQKAERVGEGTTLHLAVELG